MHQQIVTRAYVCSPELQKAMKTNAVSVRLLPRVSETEGNTSLFNTFAPHNYKKQWKSSAFQYVCPPDFPKPWTPMLCRYFCPPELRKALKTFAFSFQYFLSPELQQTVNAKLFQYSGPSMAKPTFSCFGRPLQNNDFIKELQSKLIGFCPQSSKGRFWRSWRLSRNLENQWTPLLFNTFAPQSSKKR